MKKLSDFEWRCYWDKQRICENDLLCGGCEYQPADEEKPNFKNPPMMPKEYSYGMPICPSCGEMPYSYDRCVFCGQALDMSDAPEEKMKIRGGHETNGQICCDSCGSTNLRMVAMGDGYDEKTVEMIHSYTYNCECGNVVTVIRRVGL